jgi:hypothetical protein
MEPNDYVEIPLCETLYFFKGTGLLAVAVQGSPCAPTALILVACSLNETEGLAK